MTRRYEEVRHASHTGSSTVRGSRLLICKLGFDAHSQLNFLSGQFDCVCLASVGSSQF